MLDYASTTVLETISRKSSDWLDFRDNAHSAFPIPGRRGPSFSIVDAAFRLRRIAQFSIFETNQSLVDKA